MARGMAGKRLVEPAARSTTTAHSTAPRKSVSGSKSCMVPDCGPRTGACLTGYPSVRRRLPDFALDLDAGVRPIRTFAGLPGPLADARAAQIDLVPVRENTEGLFHARDRGRLEGNGEGAAALDTMKISHRGTARICDFALGLARQRKAQGKPGRVTNVDKANVFQSMSFWRQVFEERARAFPDVACSTVRTGRGLPRQIAFRPPSGFFAVRAVAIFRGRAFVASRTPGRCAPSRRGAG
ncbi:MAG: isocitrate/isopropylmalate family dehydrogenase [Burkholderiaceae bacterium]